MKLERIEVRRLRLPLLHPFETSFGRTTAKEFLLLAVSADGVTGYGECVAEVDPFYLPETCDTALHVLRDFLGIFAVAEVPEGKLVNLRPVGVGQVGHCCRVVGFQPFDQIPCGCCLGHGVLC